MTIRELVDEKVNKLRTLDSLTAVQVSQEAVELSSLLASCRKELIDRKVAYHKLQRDMLLQHTVAARARIHSEATDEFRQVLEAESYVKMCREMLTTCNAHVRLAEAEERQAKY